MDGDPVAPDSSDQHLGIIRNETRFEIGLLHTRVNALLSAEAFLTIAFTAAMSNGAAARSTISVIISTTLAVLGLLLALLALPGINATANIVLELTDQQGQLLSADRTATAVYEVAAAGRAPGRTRSDQRRSLLFFRAAPVLFAIVWTAFTVISLT